MSRYVDYLNPYKKWCGKLNTRSGGGFQTSCPLHPDKKPSMSISQKDNGNGYVHHCHSCGDSGDSATVAELVGLKKSDYYENPVRISRPKSSELTTAKVSLQPSSIKEKPQNSANGLDLEESTSAKVNDTLSSVSLPFVSDELVGEYADYLWDNFHLAKDNGWDITKECALAIGLGFDSKTNKIVIPIRNEGGKVLTMKRHKDGGYFPKESDKKIRFYPAERISYYDKKRGLFIVAGEKDCEAWVSASVSLPPVEITDNYPRNMEKIAQNRDLFAYASAQVATATGGEMNIPKDDKWDIVNGFPWYRILYDNDKVGRDGSMKMAKAIRRHNPDARISIHYWDKTLPEGFDVSDWLDRYEDKSEGLFEMIDYICHPDRTTELADIEAEELKSLTNIGDFKMIRPNDISETNIKPLEWFIEGLRPKGFQSVLGGTTGSGKSLLMMQEAMCIATGSDFLGYEIPAKQKVLYVDTEVGTNEFQRRFLALKRQHNFNQNDLDRHFLAISKMGNFVDAYDNIEQIIKKFRPHLVYIDNLYTSTGVDDISMNKYIKIPLQRIAMIMEKYNTSVCVICHFTKPTSNEATFELHKIAGGSFLQNWAGFVQIMCRTNNEGLRLFRQVKTRGTANQNEVWGINWNYDTDSKGQLIKAGFTMEGIEFNWNHLLEKPEVMELYMEILSEWNEGDRFDTKDWLNACNNHPEINVEERQMRRKLKQCVKLGLVKEFQDGKYKNYVRTSLKFRDWGKVA